MSRVRATTLFVIAAFIATSMIVGALIAIQWRLFTNVEQTATLVRRTLEAERDLNAFGNQISDAETSQRGFLLTGIIGYLRPYESAAQRVPVELARLKSLVDRNPAQQHRVALLDTLSAAKLAELDNTVKLATQGNRDSALEVVRTNVGDSLMRSIRTVLRAAVRAEDSVLTEGEAQLESEFVHRREVSEFLALILVLIIPIVAIILRRLRKYQDLVTLCAWTKAVNYEGEWLSFEQYLQRRFGLSATHGISPEALADLGSKLETTPRA